MKLHETDHGSYRICVQDEDFFVPDNHRYLPYSVSREGQKVVESVVYAEDVRDACLLAEKRLMENLDMVLGLPKVKDLPEPLKTVVYSQAATGSGMLFIENDEESARDWTAKKLEALSAQIDQYGLESYVEMPVDPEDAFRTMEGDPVITAYCGLALRFNFI